MDTGRAGVLGSVVRDVAIGKKFFKKQGLLPAVPFKEELYDYPAPDFQNLGGGTLTRNRALGEYTIGHPGNFGWDLGGLKSKVLFIVSQRVRQTGAGVFISNTLPSTHDLPDGSYYAFMGQGGASATIAKRATGAYTTLATNGDIRQDFGQGQSTWSLAFYYDDATDALIFFMKTGAEQWFKVLEITDTTFTTMRYFGILADNGGGGVGENFWSVCPFAAYGEA